MRGRLRKKAALNPFLIVLMLALLCGLGSGCRELETIKREVQKKLQSKILKTRKPFVPREGITIRSCSLYQTANPNSEVISRLAAETPIHLVDKIGDWFRVRTRDGREGYLDEKVVGGDEIIVLTKRLRKSIEGMPVQAEGVVKNKANFRLQPGREPKVVEILQPGKKLEMFERVVTLRHLPGPSTDIATRGGSTERSATAEASAAPPDSADELMKKDVWYKVKLEDGRVGYLYTHNIEFTPPEDIARRVTHKRLVAWRVVSTSDDPDLGAKNNYVVACAPFGSDPGCDYTTLYFISWSGNRKRHVVHTQINRPGILPITNYHFEGKPGFSIRYLHPSKKDKLVLASFVLSRKGVRLVSEEEIPNPSEIH